MDIEEMQHDASSSPSQQNYSSRFAAVFVILAMLAICQIYTITRMSSARQALLLPGNRTRPPLRLSRP